MKSAILLLAAFCLTACATRPHTAHVDRPNFDTAVEQHLAAIADRDLLAFRKTITAGPTLYTIFPNGYALTTPDEAIAFHKDWFSGEGWSWDGTVIHKVEGETMGFVLMRYEYRDSPADEPSVNWLTLVFQLQDGQWRLVHDQNTGIEPSP